MSFERAPQASQLAALAELFARGPIAVLTGAGISTESGIPDYRGPETRRRARSPVQYLEFLRKAEARRRYWARSMVGYPRFARARPNVTHHVLDALARRGLVTGIITQNVDGLHAAAGSAGAIELHGALREVVCLACGARQRRAALQERLERENPEVRLRGTELAPDGDADLPDEQLARFRIVDCTCGGALKPDVVFFGENVPPARVSRAMARVEEARGLLVVGSSLAVYSGLRFVQAAARRGLPTAIVSLGETRGDSLATLRVDAAAGLTLRALGELLGVG